MSNDTLETRRDSAILRTLREIADALETKDHMHSAASSLRQAIAHAQTSEGATIAHRASHLSPGGGSEEPGNSSVCECHAKHRGLYLGVNFVRCTSHCEICMVGLSHEETERALWRFRHQSSSCLRTKCPCQCHSATPETAASGGVASISAAPISPTEEKAPEQSAGSDTDQSESATPRNASTEPVNGEPDVSGGASPQQPRGDQRGIETGRTLPQALQDAQSAVYALNGALWVVRDRMGDLGDPRVGRIYPRDTEALYSRTVELADAAYGLHRSYQLPDERKRDASDHVYMLAVELRKAVREQRRRLEDASYPCCSACSTTPCVCPTTLAADALECAAPTVKAGREAADALRAEGREQVYAAWADEAQRVWDSDRADSLIAAMERVRAALDPEPR